MSAQAIAPFNVPEDGSVPPLPDGFVLDDHPASAANDSAPPLPSGFQADPVPITDSGMAGGFRDTNPDDQASTQLSPQETKEFYHLLQGGADADTLRQYVASKGHTLTNADDIVAQRDKLGRVAGVINYPLPKPDGGTTTSEAALRGAAEGATFGFGDELAGAAQAAKAAITGGDPSKAYNESVDQSRGLLAADQEQHPYASLAGNIGGSLLLPFGLEKAGITNSARAVGLAARDAALAEGYAPAEANRLAARAITHRLAAEGATYGGANGVGSSNGSPGQRFVSGLEGAAEGALAGAGLGSLSAKLASKAPAAEPVLTDAQLTAQAADRQGIDLLPADVGGPTTRRLTAAAAQAPLSASPIIKSAQAVTDQSQAARDRIAASIGTALDPEGTGQAVRSGAQSYIASSGQDVRNAYRIAELAAGDTKVAPTNALEALDKNIAELSDTPGGAPGLSTMQALRDELAKGDVSPAGLLRMRTTLRDQFMQQGLRGSDTERRIGQVLDAAGKDVSTGLNEAGKTDAAAAYAKAAALYKTRVDTIDNVLKPIIGSKDAPRSGEQITKTIMSDLQGNQARSVRLLNSLPPEAQATARASVINSLGNASAGAQNAAGDAFSLPQFLTQWNKIGKTAKRAFFGGEAMSALDDLARVADAAKQAQKYGNFSNTSGGIWGNLGVLFSGAVSAGAALDGAPGSALGGISAGGGAAAQLIGGHLLASPRFARWLARAPKTSLGQAAYVERLGRIAKAEPAIASQVTQLQRALESDLQSQKAAN